MNEFVSGKHLERNSDLARDPDSPRRRRSGSIVSAGTRGAGAMSKFVSSKHLESISDLTLTAPIKQGFIDAFESVTYETRLLKVMEALYKIRATQREHSEIRAFLDAAEQIQSLLDFRLAILDTEPRRLLLSATFDRPFEPYMRLIWDPLGPLLDVIFCNCEGYVSATEHGFEEYLAWVRKSQIDTDFFYAASAHSIHDIQYLTKIERLEREADKDRVPAASVIIDDLRAVTRDLREGTDEATKEMQTKIIANQMGMQALVALYRLTDLYPPDQPDGDGKYLRWATQQLLGEWGRKELDENGWSSLVQDQLDWLEADRMPKHRRVAERLEFKASGVQGGILNNYGGVKHGAMLLMRITDVARARRFIGELDVQRERGATEKEEEETRQLEEQARKRREARATKEERERIRLEAEARAAEGSYFLNLAFTRHGLINIGLPASELDRFPQEFREGMEERAGLLGDVRDSHPRRWKLPARYRPAGRGAGASAPVELSEIDIVIQLRTDRDSAVLDIVEGHPLYPTVRRLADAPDSGLELLAVEPMRRASSDPRKDHFGFDDGLSQPIPVDGTPRRELDEVMRGDVFWGYANGNGDSPPPPSAFLDNGSFLVVRKLRQHVHRLQDFVRLESQLSRTAEADGRSYRIDGEELYGKLMGRRRDGRPMITKAQDNRFSYEDDTKGEECPFQAHIRRSNPRVAKIDNNGRPTPRILRRGLSYGPPADEKKPDEAERGIFFMAYNASLAEQYEVVQRWVNGGNPTGVASWQNDPLMGIGQAGDKRTFQFQYRPEGADACETVRINIPKPFVSLQWGAYLFVPSMAAIQTIANLSPVEAEEQEKAAETRQARRGEEIVARLLARSAEGREGRIAAAAAWKTCLEDFASKDPDERGDGPAVWAAIRAYHGGVLRVPYGIVESGEDPRDAVLVASKELVMRVFRNRDRHYSMCGQMARMKQSFGPIFLGLDGGPDYEADSAINAPIMQVSEFEAFAVAYAAASHWLEGAMTLFCKLYGPPDQQPDQGRYGELDLRRDFVTPVLAAICNHWFGIPDSLRIPAHPSFDLEEEPATKDRCPYNHVDPGGWSWEAVRKPRCPGDFLATSRYCFYPDPVPRVQAYGQAQGQALREAVRAHFEETETPQAKLAARMAKLKVYDSDRDKFARTLIGVMTGFLPPADASLRWALYDWLEGKTFWRVQHDLTGASVDRAAEAALAAALEAGPDPSAAAAAAMAINPYLRAQAGLADELKRAMQKRPSPDMLWRTAIGRHRLGEVDIEDGDRIFIGIVSAVAEDAGAGVTDVYPVFGGKRETEGDDFPLHACPAYKFAMGTMTGILAALMDKVRVETLPGPLLVRISDRQDCPPKSWAKPTPAPTGRPQSLQAHAERIGRRPPS